VAAHWESTTPRPTKFRLAGVRLGPRPTRDDGRDRLDPIIVRSVHGTQCQEKMNPRVGFWPGGFLHEQEIGSGVKSAPGRVAGPGYHRSSSIGALRPIGAGRPQPAARQPGHLAATPFRVPCRAERLSDPWQEGQMPTFRNKFVAIALGDAGGKAPIPLSIPIRVPSTRGSRL
jgi:hypothetical protein